MKVKAKPLAKIVACVLSLVMIFGVFAVVAVNVVADDATLLLDWSAKSNYYSAYASDKDDNGIKITYEGTAAPRIINSWGNNCANGGGIRFTLQGAGEVKVEIKGTVDGSSYTMNKWFTAPETEVCEVWFSDVEGFTASTNTEINFYANNKSFVGYVGDLYLLPVVTANNVTLDGVAQTYSGTTYTFPTGTAAGFVAYTDGTNYYKAGDAVEITADVAFTTVAIGNLTMKQGAAIRLGDVSGIRFYTTVDDAKLSALPSDAVVEKGTLIAPADLATAGLTFDLAETNYVDVKYTASEYFEDTTFVGSLVSIKEANVTRAFIGRGYVKVTLGDITATVYASYYSDKVANNTRDVATIAYNYKNDANSDYSTLSTDLKTIVDDWASKYVAPASGIDFSKVTAHGNATATETDDGFKYSISYNQANNVAITDYVTVAVNGLEEGVVKGYKASGKTYKGDAGCHVGIEIGGVVYWDTKWNGASNTSLNSETETEFSFVGKTLHNIDFDAGWTNSLGTKKITADDLANVTAVYFTNRYSSDGTVMHITSIK